MLENNPRYGHEGMTRLGSRIFDKRNRHAIQHTGKLNDEITSDTQMDFRSMQTDHAHISKRAIKEKGYILPW